MQEKMIPVQVLKPLRFDGVSYGPGQDLEIEESRVPEWIKEGLVQMKTPDLFETKKPQTAVRQPGETADRPKTRDGKSK
jgi:hypothetical protein